MRLWAGKILEVADPKGAKPTPNEPMTVEIGRAVGALGQWGCGKDRGRPSLSGLDWLVCSWARAHVEATGIPGLCSRARGRSPPVACRAGGPPAPEAEATDGLPPGAAAAAIHWEHLLPGHVCRASPRLHEEAEPGIWRGRPRHRPSFRQKQQPETPVGLPPVEGNPLRGQHLQPEAASPLPHQRHFCWVSRPQASMCACAVWPVACQRNFSALGLPSLWGKMKTLWVSRTELVVSIAGWRLNFFFFLLKI